MFNILAAIIFFILSTLAGTSYACDLCALYTSFETQRVQESDMHFSVSEQFTVYDNIQDDGKHQDNPQDERIRSSITQLAFSYNVSDRLALQLNVPVIKRRYRRIQEGSAERGSDGGVGDIIMSARFVALNRDVYESRSRLTFFAGLELPSGDADRLAEESAHGHGSDELHGDDGHEVMSEGEEQHEHEEESGLHGAEHLRHAGHNHTGLLESTVHGHDLALGSGSLDFPLGMSFMLQHERWQFAADAQYTIRTEGDHNYRYGNDFIWRVAPGYFVYLEHAESAILNLNVGGEYKEHDEFSGDKESSTKIKTILMGPEVSVTLGDSLTLRAGLDVPLDINNTGTQLVMDYRVRAAVAYRF